MVAFFYYIFTICLCGFVLFSALLASSGNGIPTKSDQLCFGSFCNLLSSFFISFCGLHSFISSAGSVSFFRPFCFHILLVSFCWFSFLKYQYLHSWVLLLSSSEFLLSRALLQSSSFLLELSLLQFSSWSPL